MMCGCGYLFADIFSEPEKFHLFWWLEYFAINALPGVFWLVSISVFSEHVVLQRWQYVVASLTLFIPVISTVSELLFDYQLTNYPTFYGLIHYGAMMLELVLVSHALISAISQWRNDLVQDRRYIRGGVITFAGFYIIYVIVSEQLFKVHWQEFDIFKYFMLSVIVTGINLLLFRLRETSLFFVLNDKKTEHKANSKQVNDIIAAMTEQKLYREDGMTISKLSRYLAIHEYKLRQLINGELNYRNFNDFLNYYRIQEVSEKLANAELIQLPILTLALESGFRSLSSFNKAFKDTHGTTPTAYRKMHQSQG
jgi:AraC-like DNA-binding protein